MVNSVIIMGRLAADPDYKFVGSSNIPFCGFPIAVDSGFGDNKKTYFFDVQCWRNTADFVNKYFTKGSKVIVQGNLIAETYTDRDGNRRKNVRINCSQVDFAESKGSAKNASAEASSDSEPGCNSADSDAVDTTPKYSAQEDADDQLPF